MAYDEPLRLIDLLVVRRARVSVFSAPQSLVAFPIATSLIATVTRAARTIGRMESDSPWVPLFAALLAGVVIFGLTMTDADSRPKTAAGWAIAACTAAINSLLLFVAALGIEKF
jgi:hypothetical protein